MHKGFSLFVEQDCPRTVCHSLLKFKRRRYINYDIIVHNVDICPTFVDELLIEYLKKINMHFGNQHTSKIL